MYQNNTPAIHPTATSAPTIPPAMAPILDLAGAACPFPARLLREVDEIHCACAHCVQLWLIIWHSDPEGQTGQGGVINGQVTQVCCLLSSPGSSFVSSGKRKEDYRMRRHIVGWWRIEGYTHKSALWIWMTRNKNWTEISGEGSLCCWREYG
jgi:hypothetical protein